MRIASGLTLRVLRNTALPSALEPLFYEKNLTVEEEQKLFKIAVLFLNSSDRLVQDLGYRVALKICLITGKFIPLYDISAALGYTPIIEMLRRQNLVPERESFFSYFLEAYRSGFSFGENYHTEEQRALFESFKASKNESVAVVAPTSYGKSELIELLVKQILGNIVVVVPSKALVSQTKRRILSTLPSDTSYQIVVHHDSAFDIEKPILAVVTQERLLRMFQKHPSLKFSTVVIDEAHNVLNGDRRARLLSSVIMIAQARVHEVAIKYLTPFLVSSDNLRLVGAAQLPLPEIRVEERLKSENYRICDVTCEGTVQLYDHFLDRFYPTRQDHKFLDIYELLFAYKKSKNIVYLNRPRNIEELALNLSKKSRYIQSDDLEVVCREISEYVHPQYKILDCLRKGVAYHHGSVPDVVRSYVETMFRKITSLSWVITSSTLLEGVNVPAQSLFVLDPRKGTSPLSQAQFRNLVGRVNRFSEIFDKENGSPELLTPEIFVAKCHFSRADLNVRNFIKNVVKADKKLEDKVDNPLLQNTEITDEILKDRLEDFIIIENIEPDCKLLPEKHKASTAFGKSCFIHNVFEIDILGSEEFIFQHIEELQSQPIINNASDLLENIYNIFFPHIRSDIKSAERFSLTRLENSEARRFYAMFFDWRINQSNYKKMIGNFVSYWKKKLTSGNDPIIFAGKWGTIQRNSLGAPNYVDISELSDYELINLAIVRIKEEQDFIDNNLVKFLEVLNDMRLIDESLYNKIKYGTDDPIRIILIRAGLSHIASHIIAEKYLKYLIIGSNESIRILPQIREEFDGRHEKKIIVFEVDTSGLIRE